jgi:membrane carboxypeptidase/penicillin-binding protein
VDTTLDLSLQGAAEERLRGGVMQVEARRGFRTKWKNVMSQGALDKYRDPSWGAAPPDVGRRYPGLVTAVSSTSAQLRIGAYRATLAPAAIRVDRTEGPERRHEGRAISCLSS